MHLAGISRRTLYNWRQKDAEFDAIERKGLPELPDTFTKEIVYREYMRNLRMVLALDAELLDKALQEPEALTPRRALCVKQAFSGNGLRGCIKGLVELRGFEPLTSYLQSRRSPN